MSTAWHEAGHAVMAMILGRVVEKLTICPAELQTGGSRLGACKMQKGRSRSASDKLEEDVLVLLSGMVGERQYTEQYCRQGAAQDLLTARRLLLKRAGTDHQAERLERRMLDKAEHLLSQRGHAEALRLIAEELLRKETISGRAVRHLFEQAAKV
ncbi:MAG: hypothetical protein R3C49_02720 [Planctomycetaceae bacterium]